MQKPLPSLYPSLLFALLLFAPLCFKTAMMAQSQKPTLNRHPSADATPTPSQTPTPAASPAAESAQGEQASGPIKPEYPDLLQHYSYNSKAALNSLETGVTKRDDVMLLELNYAGSDDSRVPAYVLIPHGNGPFPAIIWGHWLKPGSPLANKDEFLDEALALAHAGVVSVLIDAPQVRHDFVPEKGGIEAMRQQGEMGGREVIDLRRAVDLLYARADVDRKRIAYVGHSFNAQAGAILAGVEIRIDSYVLMAGNYSIEESYFASKDPKILAQRKEIGDSDLKDYFYEHAWNDPVYFLGHTDRESIFLQYGSKDSITKEQAQKTFEMFSAKDKKMEFYDAGHALNAAARLDRDHWLQKQLGFKKLDDKELQDIPQLK